jgi:hypothetical protein
VWRGSISRWRSLAPRFFASGGLVRRGTRCLWFDFKFKKTLRATATASLI